MAKGVRPIGVFAVALLAALSVVADDKPTAPSNSPAPAQADVVRDKQLDVSYEARDIERVLSRLKRASELSKKRIVESAEAAEAVSAALQKGDRTQARADAQRAEGMFREIATLLEALLAEEAAPRVAASRDLAAQLSRLEAELAGELQREARRKEPRPDGGGGKRSQDPKGKSGASDEPRETENPESGGAGASQKEAGQKEEGQGMADERRNALADRAEKLARQAQILEDILKALTEAPEPGGEDLAEKINASLKEIKLPGALAAMQKMPGEIRAGALPDAERAARDVADRMAVLAQRLEAAYRSTVAPQIEELRSLDQSVDSLRKRLDELETQAQIAAWHREARAMIERAEAAGLDSRIVQPLSEQLTSGQTGVSNVYDWKLIENRFVPPDEYGAHFGHLQMEIQERIRVLLARDITSLGDDKTPPKYQELVERYYQVLSNRQEPAPAPTGAKPAAGREGARPKSKATTPP